MAPLLRPRVRAELPPDEWGNGNPQNEAATPETVVGQGAGSSTNLFAASPPTSSDTMQISGSLQLQDRTANTTYALIFTMLAGNGQCDGFVTVVPSTSS